MRRYFLCGLPYNQYACNEISEYRFLLDDKYGDVYSRRIKSGYFDKNIKECQLCLI